MKKTKRRVPSKLKATGKKPVARKTSTGDPVDKEVTSMYAVATHWRSDLAFFNDELSFFRKLFDKNITGMIDAVNVDRTRELIDLLMKEELKRLKLEERVIEHLDHLASWEQNPFSHDEQQIRAEHGVIEISIANFVSNFRRLKKALFELTEKVMRAEKSKHLIGGKD